MFGNQVVKIAKSYWFLGLVQVAHSMEETGTKLYLEFSSMSEALHQLFPWFPLFEISADVFAILNYLIIALMLGSVVVVEKGKSLGFIFMWIWAIIELLNGAFHVGTWIFLHAYFPGGVSGSILFILSILFIRQLRATANQATRVI